MGRQSKGDSNKSPKTSTSRSTTQVMVRKDPTSTRRPHEAKGREVTTKRTGGSSMGRSTTKMTTTARPGTVATSRRTSRGTSSKPTTSAPSTASAEGYNEKHQGNNQPPKGRSATEKGILTREDGELQARKRKFAIVKMKARCGWNSSEHCKWVDESCQYVGGPREVQTTGKTGVSASGVQKSAALGHVDYQNNHFAAFLLLIIVFMKLFRL